MTSEMETAFEAAHHPQTSDDLVAGILADLEREQPPDAGDDVGELRQVPKPWASDLELYNDAIRTLEQQVVALKAKPPRERRTGAAARMNPDDIRLARGVLTGTAVFGVAAIAASFGGQYAMAVYTRLPEYLWLVVPMFIEAPIILLSFMIPVFRRRKQHVTTPWLIMLLLTTVSSAINVLHVWIESGGLPTPGDWSGATVMGLAPWLVLLLFEEFVRLAVKPTGEHPETPAAAPAARKTPNRKGTRK